ncbi:MAG: hypothetical protein EHM93_07455 [Bacteroidales bacterium]|nr:MAG: hypothetical protein EHM93_07455 [Bacteroidales bacterium]
MIFLFFLIVSTIIWYLSKLSHEYSTTMAYPIRYENLPKGKVLVGEPPRRIQLRVKAFGYTLLKEKMSAALSPIELDLGKHLSQSFEGSKVKQFILTYRLRNSIVKQFGSEILLEGIEPDTLYVELSDMVNKMVRIHPQVEVDYEQQYMASGDLTLEPDSIAISGPKSVIDTIKLVNTKQVKFKNLNQRVLERIQIIPINQVTFSTRSVTLSIPVEKYTEITIKVPVDIENQPDSVKLMFIPKTIDVKCNVVLSKYFILKPIMFRAVVNYNLISNSLTKKMKVRIVAVPDFVNLVDFSPKYVEYIIEKRK